MALRRPFTIWRTQFRKLSRRTTNICLSIIMTVVGRVPNNLISWRNSSQWETSRSTFQIDRMLFGKSMPMRSTHSSLCYSSGYVSLYLCLATFWTEVFRRWFNTRLNKPKQQCRSLSCSRNMIFLNRGKARRGLRMTRMTQKWPKEHSIRDIAMCPRY